MCLFYKGISVDNLYKELAVQALSKLSNPPHIILNQSNNLPAWNDTYPDKKLLNHEPKPKDKSLLIYKPEYLQIHYTFDLEGQFFHFYSVISLKTRNNNIIHRSTSS